MEMTYALERRPNIVFLLSDDQAVSAVGCYGNKHIITPHLDRLASQGQRFINHYNTTAICMASRASVMTGLYEYRHGCNFDHGALGENIFDQSYPVKLRKSGYLTGFAGKIGFLIEGQKFEAFAEQFDVWAGGPNQTHYATAQNQGIAKYANAYPHCSRAYGAWAGDFIKMAKEQRKPFCMSISFKAPHLPFDPDPIDLERYPEGKPFPRPANYGGEHGKHLSAQAHTSRATTGYREWIVDYDGSMRKYCALITGVDAAVGMIREALEREGLTDNTVIIFSSDNGYHCGAHGFGDKVLPYEEASKAPLIVFDPRIDNKHAGQTRQALTGNVDLFSTICDFAEIPTQAGIDGKTLRPLLSDSQAKIRDWLPLFNFWGAHSAQSMAVVSTEWKFIHWYYGGKGMKPVEECFHLAADRGEMTRMTGAQHAAIATARIAYDAELTALRTTVIRGHGYEPYPVLFDRTTPWQKKEVLLPTTKPNKQN
jgi:arylsulfatase A-like enzyme